MNKLTIFAFLICVIWSSNSSVDAASPYLNLGFQSGKFTGWIGYNWIYSTEVSSYNTSKTTVTLPTSRRQVIMSDTTAYDQTVGGLLKIIPSGYKYSARLGDVITSADGAQQGSFRCWEQSLEYKLKVDTTNSLLIMKFACVLQYAPDHTALMEPRFKLTLYDQSGNTINTCANYDVYSSSSVISGFKTYVSTNSQFSMAPDIKWRDWTTVGADLSAYKNQTVTIEFMSADCTGQFHFGYAYFVADCQPMALNTKYCAGNDTAIVTAPEGFESYKWKNAKDSIVSTNQILYVFKPEDGAYYKCVLTSATGCIDSLSTIIWKYDPQANFSVTPVSCNDSIYQVVFNNLSTTNRGTLSYLWNFSDGTDTTTSPLHTFKTSGWHPVSLTVSNTGSECTVTKLDSVETFYPPLVGISGDTTYCPGYSTTLKGYGADHYDWTYNGTTYKSQDSIVISSPGGIVAMTGYRSDNICQTTKYKTIFEEPYWDFTTTPDTVFCEGDVAVLKAWGALTYLWNTNEKTSSITVKTPGVYTVVGLNPRGCEKTSTIIVTESPIPSASFSISSTIVNSRHDQLDCSIPQETGVTYYWNFGDSTDTEQGSSVSHTYKNTELYYGSLIITLLSVNNNGCSLSSTKDISVVPFIPNVFTPNGDGVNDLFVPGVQLQLFDRYGMKLYEGDTGWDGTYNGTKMDNDTYFYIIKYTDSSKQLQTLKGYVTLKK